jgi:hypothetical protein
MLAAVDLYVHKDHNAEWKLWERRCNVISDAIKGVKTVKTKIFVPEIANSVPHLDIQWDEEAVGRTRGEVIEAMRTGKPQIELRPGGPPGVTIGVWMMQEGDEEIVGKRLREELEKG